jgi:hypothetical protein
VMSRVSRVNRGPGLRLWKSTLQRKQQQGKKSLGCINNWTAVWWLVG